MSDKMSPSLSTFLSMTDVVEYLIMFLSLEDTLALACTSKCWREAVNQRMIWRLLEKREEEMVSHSFLKKEYRDYANKYNLGTLDPLCEEAFVLLYPRYLERSWDEYVRMRYDDLEEIEEKESDEKYYITLSHSFIRCFITLTLCIFPVVLFHVYYHY